MHVSIAQSRKALLPPRLLPMAESIPLSFNRSVAKSPSATRGAKDERLCEVARFQSLSREKPFCHSKRSRSIKREREFQSLSREKPFCHETTTTVHTMPGQHVSIAQSRKALLPPAHWQPSRLLDKACFNRSVAKSPSATPYGGHKMATQTKMFQSLSREKPFCHPARSTPAERKSSVSIAQSRKALLPRSGSESWRKNAASFKSLSREKPFCHIRADSCSHSRRAFQSLSREKPFCHKTSFNDTFDTRISFNRSVAKSPSATKTQEWAQKNAEKFQSLSREKPFCHLNASSRPLTRPWSFNRSVAKSPSATIHTKEAGLVWTSFNRSVAKSPSATFSEAITAILNS